MKRDLRLPEDLGKALTELKQSFPKMSAPERADLLERFSANASALASINGNGTHVNGK